MGDRRRWLGRAGEWLALGLLLLKGYRVRHRNWRCSLGELDLVMVQRREIVFVEVKTRSGRNFGGAAGAVDGRKRQRLARLAEAYLSSHELWDRPCRFDVIAVEGRRGLLPLRILHFRDAFSVDRGRIV